MQKIDRTGFAVILALLFAPACAMESADSGSPQSEARVDAPLTVSTTDSDDDSEYAITPFGRAHRSCVHDVGEGASIERDGSFVSRGARHAAPPPCGHALKGGRNQARQNSSSTVPTISGWLWDYNATATGMTNNWFTEATGSWLVPQAPASYTSQTLFYFNGFEPASGNAIIQPVLQYGGSAAGGGNYWSTAVWYIDQFGNVYHSTLTSVSVGVTLTGYLTSSGCASNGLCNWTVQMKHNGTVQNSMLWAATEKFDWFFPAVAEFYGFTSCNQNPNQASAMYFSYSVFGAGSSYNGRQAVYPSLSAYLDYSATPWCNWRSGGGINNVDFAF
jgi:hypothetical protein